MGTVYPFPFFSETFQLLPSLLQWNGQNRSVRRGGLQHHITQRGNARQIVFEDLDDRRVYVNLLRGYSEEHRLSIWAWCLMTNHIHLLASRG